MAGVYKGLTVKIGADMAEFDTALKGIDRKAREIAREFEQVEKTMRLQGSGPKQLARQMELVSQQAANARDKLELLRKAESEIGQGGMSTDQWTKLQSDIEACEHALDGYADKMREIGAQQAADSSLLGRAGNALASNAEAFEKVGSGMQKVGGLLTRTVTPAIVGGAAASVKAAVDIDTALTGVRKTVDGTEADYQRLKDAAIEFSKTSATSATDFLDAQALGAQLGFAIDELQEFAEVATGLDIATNMDLETAGSEMARFANITKMSHGDIDKYASAIVNVGNNMATTESEVSAMAMRLAAAGTQVGMSQADILGLAGALSSLGVEAEAGGTAVSTVMANIDKAVASGDASLETWATTAGMQAEEFAEKWKSSPVDALAAVLSGMEKATEEGGNMSLMLEELGISSIRQTDIMKRMAGNSELMAEGVKYANEGWSENMALSQEVANRNESLAAKFEMLKNRLVAVAEEVGAPLADALLAAVDAAEPLFEAIEKGARAFSEMSESEQRAVLQTLALSAALGPALTATGGLVKGLGSLGEGMNGLAKGLAKADMKVFGTAATEASVAAGAAATGGIALLVAALAGAAIGIGNAVKEANDYRDATSGLREATDNAVSAITGTAGAFEEQAGAAESSRDRIKSAMEEQARIARDLDTEMSEIGKDSTLLDHYTQKIAELAGHCDGDAQKLGELRVAVEQYNQITGDNVGIVDDQTGAIDRSTAALEANAEAWEKAAYSQALQEKMTELAKVQIDNQENLRTASEKLKDAEAELAEVRENTPWDFDKILEATMKVEGLRDQVSEAKDASEANAEAMARLSDQASTLAQQEAEARERAAELAAEHDRLKGEFEEAGLSAEDATAKMAQMDAQGIDPKHYYVTDDGTIKDNMGRVLDLDNKTLGGKPYEVTDNGTCSTEISKVEEVDAELIRNKLFDIEADGSRAEATVDRVQAEKIDDKDFAVTVKDYATSVLSGIVGWLGQITNREATITTRHVTVADARNAAGGIAVPKHMAGAIVTQATLTDMGIVGEAGAEAVLQGANGARAIVPLTNRRYVRPFAQAVAAEMGGMGGSTVVKNYNVNGVSYLPDSRMASLVEQVVDMAIVEDRM